MTDSVPLCLAIGRNVEHCRTHLRLTQDGLARLLRATGVEWTDVTVAKVETGRREVKAGELVALGLALGVPPEALLASSTPVTLGRSDSWVPADAVTTWVRGEQASVSQRAQWALNDAPDAAPLRLLDDRARRMAAYLSHLPEGSQPSRLNLAEVDEALERVEESVAEWETQRRASGSTVSPWSRRTKERHLWAREGRGDVDAAHE